MFPPLVAALGLAACTAAPPEQPATPALVEAAAAAVERELGSVVARRLPDGSIVLTPGRGLVLTPGPDGSGTPPRWLEFAIPAGVHRTHTARTETLITVPRGAVLEISNLFGDIKVDGWNRNQVRIVAEHGRRDQVRTRIVEQARQVARRVRRVEAELRRAETELRKREHELAARHRTALHVETLDRLGVPAAVDYNITVPQWMALKLSGMESDITVAGVRGAIQAESIRGDVQVRGGRGPLQISSVEGEVKAFDCAGGLEATSINSGVELDDVAGILVVESVNGDIQIGRVKSDNVTASSVNGTVVYRGEFEPRGRYRLASHSGNLVVGVPVDAAVDVSVATFQGGFRSGFPVEVGPWRKGEKFNFVLGSGGSSLELESFLGLIELLRPAEVPAVAPTPRVAPAPKVPRTVRIVKTPTAPKAPRAPRPPQPDDDDRDDEEDK